MTRLYVTRKEQLYLDDGVTPRSTVTGIEVLEHHSSSMWDILLPKKFGHQTIPEIQKFLTEHCLFGQSVSVFVGDDGEDTYAYGLPLVKVLAVFADDAKLNTCFLPHRPDVENRSALMEATKFCIEKYCENRTDTFEKNVAFLEYKVLGHDAGEYFIDLDDEFGLWTCPINEVTTGRPAFRVVPIDNEMRLLYPNIITPYTYEYMRHIVEICTFGNNRHNELHLLSSSISSQIGISMVGLPKIEKGIIMHYMNDRVDRIFDSQANLPY